MPQDFPIGQMAKLFHTTIKTLRYYDARGLLKPARVSASGYRYYTSDQFERLNTIRYLQGLGLSLADIQAHLDAPNRVAFVKQLQEQRALIAQQIAALQKSDAQLALRIDDLKFPPTFLQPRLATLPARACVRLDAPIRSNADIELGLRQIDAGLPIFSGGVGLIRPRKSVLAGDYGAFSALFVLTADGDATLAAGDYACIAFNGDHDHADAAYARLLAFIEAAGLRVAGDAIERTRIDQDVSADPAEYCTEIQLPVLTRP